MAKKKQYIFKTGGNLSDETPFKKGEIVPADIKKEDLEALLEMDAVEVKNGNDSDK